MNVTSNAAISSTPHEGKGAASNGQSELPFLLTPKQLAALLGVCERTLERQRREGNGTIPFVKNGRRVYYPRNRVMEVLAERTFNSTAEAKRAASQRRLAIAAAAAAA